MLCLFVFNNEMRDTLRGASDHSSVGNKRLQFWIKFNLLVWFQQWLTHLT